jgi:transcriptional regulator with XRE-family HTH domain
MNRFDLIKKVKNRRKQLNITLENLAKNSGVSYRTLTRFLAGDDIMMSGIEKITRYLGLDFAGNEEQNE